MALASPPDGMRRRCGWSSSAATTSAASSSSRTARAARAIELDANPRAAVVFYCDPAARSSGARRGTHRAGERRRVGGVLRLTAAVEPDRRLVVRPVPPARGPGRAAEPHMADERRFEGADVPLPPFWGGYRLVPDAFEMWVGRRDRLHDRVRYERDANGWRRERLAPEAYGRQARRLKPRPSGSRGCIRARRSERGLRVEARRVPQEEPLRALEASRLDLLSQLLRPSSSSPGSTGSAARAPAELGPEVDERPEHRLARLRDRRRDPQLAAAVEHGIRHRVDVIDVLRDPCRYLAEPHVARRREPEQRRRDPDPEWRKPPLGVRGEVSDQLAARNARPAREDGICRVSPSEGKRT